MSLALYLPTPLIGVAGILDLALGDPPWLPHPVRLIGAAIASGERLLRTGSSRLDLLNGCLLAIGVVSLTSLCAWMLIAAGERFAPVMGVAVAVVLGWTTLALRGLDEAAAEIEASLKADDENRARGALPALVGRDPEALDREGIVRATVESLAENCSDGVVAPLFFLFVGGPVAALAYKAINTMDSMIGYRDERYLFFGRVAARMDDVANFIPARLTALCIAGAAALRLGRGVRALTCCYRYASRHASPNAGYPEATMAGALGIELGGGAVYQGQYEHRALLGIGERIASVGDINLARNLTRTAGLLAFAALTLGRFVVVNLAR